MALFHRTKIYGLEFDAISRDLLETAILDRLAVGAGGWVVTANLEFLRQFRRTEEVRALLTAADVVIADGMPIVWASRIARRPLPERVAGSDLIHTLSARAAEQGRSVFLLGGADGAANEAAQRLGVAHKQLKIAGTLCPAPGFDRCPERVHRAISQVSAARPDIVYVGLGFPKQERLIRAMRSSLPEAWFVGCGVSIDFVAGYVDRAPTWTHRLGLEWVYRLYKEPMKLFRRYLVDGIPFAIKLALWAFVQRFETAEH